MTPEATLGPADTPADARTLSRFDRLVAYVEDLLNLIAALAIFGLMFLGVLQILLRKSGDLLTYLQQTIPSAYDSLALEALRPFAAPITGYIDFVELSMATFAFLGAAYTQRLGGHIRMEMLIGVLRGRALWAVECLGTLLALFVVGVLVWYGWDHFMRAYTNGDSTIDAEYPTWPSKLLVPVAFGVWWLRLALQAIGFARLTIAPKAVPVAVPLMKSVSAQADDEIRDAFGSQGVRAEVGEGAPQPGADGDAGSGPEGPREGRPDGQSDERSGGRPR
ncbi:MAG: TRAP transporter small permease [Pseudomonadota bacterium]